ncbi:MAG: class E sortase [Candidatus Paceibacterota bacterium]|jgi:LPXTG-site transpeptidase (sortase) family protein
MIKQFFEANKRYIKFFAVFYLIAIFALNWNQISWAINFKFLTNAAESFFVESGKFFYSEKKANNTQAVNSTGTIVVASREEDIIQKEDSLVIEKIGMEAPLVTSPSDSVEDVEASLKKGVMIYPNSSLPSEKGTTIILGHTAPVNWPRVNYYGIFNRLDEIQKGDQLLVYFQGRQYVYIVARQFLVNPGDQLVPSLTNYENVLFLSTCWPPNVGDHRIIIEAVR